MADLDAIRDLILTALAALDELEPPPAEKRADKRADARYADNADRQRAYRNRKRNDKRNDKRNAVTDSVTDKGGVTGSVTPPPSREGGCNELPAVTRNALQKNVTRNALTDLADWRADRAPLTDEQAATGKAGLASARAALHARRTGS